MTIDVDLGRGTVEIVREGSTLGRAPVPVAIVASALRSTAVGVNAPAGRRRVMMDVALRPAAPVLRFDASSLVPRPPGLPGAVVIAEEATVVATPGSVSVQSGTDVVIELPGAGRVVPSADFDGDGTPGAHTPFAFFAPRRCTDAPDRGCFRYEIFTSPADRRTIGFVVDPTVLRFRARLLVTTDVVSP